MHGRQALYRQARCLSRYLIVTPGSHFWDLKTEMPIHRFRHALTHMHARTHTCTCTDTHDIFMYTLRIPIIYLEILSRLSLVRAEILDHMKILHSVSFSDEEDLELMCPLSLPECLEQ